MSFADDDVCGVSITCGAGVLVQRRCCEGEGMVSRGKLREGDESGRDCVRVELVEC